jgi:hypothetical protein
MDAELEAIRCRYMERIDTLTIARNKKEQRKKPINNIISAPQSIAPSPQPNTNQS